LLSQTLCGWRKNRNEYQRTVAEKRGQKKKIVLNDGLKWGKGSYFHICITYQHQTATHNSLYITVTDGVLELYELNDKMPKQFKIPITSKKTHMLLLIKHVLSCIPHVLHKYTVHTLLYTESVISSKALAIKKELLDQQSL
jgi:hypothetical protein